MQQLGKLRCPTTTTSTSTTTAPTATTSGTASTTLVIFRFPLSGNQCKVLAGLQGSQDLRPTVPTCCPKPYTLNPEPYTPNPTNPKPRWASRSNASPSSSSSIPGGNPSFHFICIALSCRFFTSQQHAKPQTKNCCKF